MKLIIECQPWVYRILSGNYSRIVPSEDQLVYTLENYFSDILMEAAQELVLEEDKDRDNDRDNDNEKEKRKMLTRISQRMFEATGRLTE